MIAHLLLLEASSDGLAARSYLVSESGNISDQTAELLLLQLDLEAELNQRDQKLRNVTGSATARSVFSDTDTKKLRNSRAYRFAPFQQVLQMFSSINFVILCKFHGCSYNPLTLIRELPVTDTQKSNPEILLVSEKESV